MNDHIRNKIMEKAEDARLHTEEIGRLAESLPGCDRDSVVAGILAGRLYNAFYYQTRRLLHRNPTPEEFDEFLGIISDTKVADAGGSW